MPTCWYSTQTFYILHPFTRCNSNQLGSPTLPESLLSCLSSATLQSRDPQWVNIIWKGTPFGALAFICSWADSPLELLWKLTCNSVYVPYTRIPPLCPNTPYRYTPPPRSPILHSRLFPEMAACLFHGFCMTCCGLSNPSWVLMEEFLGSFWKAVGWKCLDCETV
jgi:hypothetical protein